VESEKRTSRSNNQKLSSMKKSLQKLTLNKSAISNLSQKIKGGFRRADGTFPTNDPTANTGCFDCPPTTMN